MRKKKRIRFPNIARLFLAIIFAYIFISLLMNIFPSKLQFTNINSILGSIAYGTGAETSEGRSIDFRSIVVYVLLIFFIVLIILFALQRISGSTGTDEYEKLKQKWRY